MPGEWKPEVIEAVQRWLDLQPGASGQQRWKCLGEAKPGSEPDWLVLDNRGNPIKIDALMDLCLAGPDGPDRTTAYPVEAYREVDGVLLLREAPGLPATSRLVWTKSMSVRFLTENAPGRAA